jgi:hypothetical protein
MASNYTLNDATYLINGNDITTYGAVVQQSSGFLDEPKRKSLLSFSWPEENGLDIDLSGGYYIDARNPKIVFLLKGSDYHDLQVKRMQLVALFKRPGYQYIKLAGMLTLSLAYMADQAVFELLSNLRDMPCGGRLTVNLTEPFPETKQFYTVKTGAASSSLTISASKPVTVDWGDGYFSYVAVGTATVTHNYLTAGTYGIVVYPTDGIISITPTGCADIYDLIGAILTGDNATFTGDNSRFTADMLRYNNLT